MRIYLFNCFMSKLTPVFWSLEIYLYFLPRNLAFLLALKSEVSSITCVRFLDDNMASVNPDFCNFILFLKESFEISSNFVTPKYSCPDLHFNFHILVNCLGERKKNCLLVQEIAIALLIVYHSLRVLLSKFLI